MAFCHSKETSLPFPLIADPERKLADSLGMIDPVAKDTKCIPLTCRGVFIVDPQHKLRLSMLYPASVGRNYK